MKEKEGKYKTTQRKRKRDYETVAAYKTPHNIYALWSNVVTGWPRPHKLANSWLRLWPVVN